MKLLLDEMYSPSIAEGLRVRGHDVVAVVERLDLRTRPDSEVFAVAQREQRAVVSENIGDFVRIANEYAARGDVRHGVVLVEWAKYRRGNRRTIGALVRALDALTRRCPSDQPTSARIWL